VWQPGLVENRPHRRWQFSGGNVARSMKEENQGGQKKVKGTAAEGQSSAAQRTAAEVPI
jgi:hypothetical protein